MYDSEVMCRILRQQLLERKPVKIASNPCFIFILSKILPFQLLWQRHDQPHKRQADASRGQPGEWQRGEKAAVGARQVRAGGQGE